MVIGKGGQVLKQVGQAAARSQLPAGHVPRAAGQGRQGLAAPARPSRAAVLSGDRPLAVVDIDGVIADVRHRLHHLEGRRKAWGPFFAAAPSDGVHPEGAAIVETLTADHDIVFVTGRPEDLRAVTETWLDKHGFGDHRLVMRGRGDRRPAAQAKVELIAELAAERTIGIVVDDDRQVLEAARAAGYPTFHADWERRAPAAEAARHDAQDVDGRT